MTSKASDNMRYHGANRHSGAASEKQKAAREEIEIRTSRTLKDAEWDRAQDRLVQFALILRSWHLHLTTDESDVGKAA